MDIMQHLHPNPMSFGMQARAAFVFRGNLGAGHDPRERNRRRSRFATILATHHRQLILDTRRHRLFNFIGRRATVVGLVDLNLRYVINVDAWQVIIPRAVIINRVIMPMPETIGAGRFKNLHFLSR